MTHPPPDDTTTEPPAAPTEITLQDLRDIPSSAWDIECDETLLEFMESFSQRMMDRLKRVQGQVDDLVDTTRTGEADLLNTFNEFIMLSNTQFIENVRTPARWSAVWWLPLPLSSSHTTASLIPSHTHTTPHHTTPHHTIPYHTML